MKFIFIFLLGLICCIKICAQSYNDSTYKLNGDAKSESCHCYILTPDTAGKTGSVWNKFKINLNNSFTFIFDVNLGCRDEGADGIAFVLQPISTSIGSIGGGLGFEHIDTSIGVTLDTYYNGLNNDPLYDHIAIQRNGDLDHKSVNNLAGPIQISDTSDNIEDCLTHTLKISWNATTKKLDVYFDGILRVSTVNNFVKTTFNGNPLVFWGFTGATGSFYNLQKFCTSLKPSFHLPVTQKNCANRAIQFLDSTISFAPIMKSDWDFGDSSYTSAINPIHVYKKAGDYKVTQTVTGADGCQEISTQQITVYNSPVADFTFDNICINNTNNFNSTSTIQDGIINTWYWNLGEGQTSTLQNTSKFYTTSGLKSIKLSVKSQYGCVSDTIEHIIEIYPNAISDFSFIDNQCLQSNVQFNDSSHVAGGIITNWSWNFNNGDTSSLQNPLIYFTNPGTYNIILHTFSNHGCPSNLITKPIIIHPKPIAYFFHKNFCQLTQSLSLSDSSYSTDGSVINSWWWDFGDGQTSIQQNPAVVYSSAGSYTIRLVVKTFNCISDTFKQTIIVNTKPVASFTSTNSCQDSAVYLKDASSILNSAINAWYWDFGNGQTSILQNPSITYKTPGNKIIKLVSVSAEGCVSDTISRTIEIYPKPVSNFTFTNNLCQKNNVQFTDQSTGNINGWQWDFGNRLNSNLKNPLIPFDSSGQFYITLKTLSDKGCMSDNKSQLVTITPKPIANFLYSTACQSSHAFFIDSSYSPDGSPIKSWWWDLGNGQFSNQSNPSLTYNVQANYTIKLVVTTTSCISDTFIKVISVNGLPTANFTLNNACQDSTVYLKYIPSGSTVNSWYWNFGNGQTSILQNPIIIYSSFGTKRITLSVESTDGCISDTISKTVEIYPKPTSNFTFTNNICQNSIIQFTDQSLGNVTGWFWDFGNNQTANQQNPVTSYNASGTFTTTLISLSDKGCKSDAKSQTVTITANPIAYFNNNFPCETNATIFTDSSYTINALPITQWYWDFGNGKTSTLQNPSLIYNAAGSYTVKLVVTANCVSDTFSKVITINSRPIANFNSMNACEDSLINLADASSVANSTITNWYWDFGNGQTSALQNPSVIYYTPGSKIIKLLATSATGCLSDTAFKAMEIYTKPAANFTFTNNLCQNSGIQFKDKSLGNVTAWFWNFGNGDSSTQQNPIAIYPAAGTYQASLISQTDKGCKSDAITKFVTITTKPVAYFKNNIPCELIPVIFSDSSYSSDGSVIKQWYWDLGNGQTSTLQNPSLIYANAGSYTIKLVVYTNCISDTFTKVITLSSKPVANFNIMNACQDSIINLSDKSSVTHDIVTNWYWDFGNGQTSSQQNASVIYNTAGSKIIKLVATSATGCTSDTASKAVQVYPKPVSDFNFINNLCQNSVVQFTDKSIVLSGTITAWRWDLGNGQTIAQQNPITQYTSGGIYYVSLTSESDKGCRSDAVTKSVTIISKPVAYFKNNIPCELIPVIFSDSSYSSDGSGIKQWYWNFGNGQTSTLQNPSILFSGVGSYTIKLVVSTNCISDTFNKIITLTNKPVANFNNINACQDSSVNLTDASSVANSTVTKWYWNFGNGQSSTLQNPSVIYNSPGNKIIKLITTSALGCTSDTVSKAVEVYPKPIANFSFGNTCLQTNIQFTNQSAISSGTINAWQWNFGNGQTSSLQTPSMQYNTAATYQASLIVQSDKGCNSISAVKIITINDKPTANFTYKNICQTTTAYFTDSSYTYNGSSITSWYWSFGNGQTSTMQNPSTFYAAGNSATIKLLVQSSDGCYSDTLIKYVIINQRPIANFSYSIPLCTGPPIAFSDSSAAFSGSITNYYWLFDNGNFSTLQNPIQAFTSGDRLIKLSVKNSSGCFSDTAFKILHVNSKPLVNMNFADACLNNIVSFSATYSTDNILNSFTWNFGDGSAATGNNVQHSYNAIGIYPVSLFAVSQNGCLTDTLRSLIHISILHINAGNDIIATAMEPVQLQATTGGASYIWSPSTGLSNSYISNPVATVSANQTYYLKVVNSQGCAAYDTLNIKVYKGPDVYIPNAFTPNNDGINDAFKIVPVGITQINYLKVFNRWGEEIFATSDYNRGWDGRYKGIDQPTGNYVWILSAVDFKGNVIRKRGTVMLIR